MSAVEEYRNNPWGMSAARSDGVGSGGYVDFTPKMLADAAIAELEALDAIEDGTHALVERIAELEAELATEREHPTSILQCAACQRLAVVQNAQLGSENERLKVCGNCDEWHPSGRRCYMGDDGTVFTDRMDSCHFDPSRWAERITP